MAGKKSKSSNKQLAINKSKSEDAKAKAAAAKAKAKEKAKDCETHPSRHERAKNGAPGKVVKTEVPPVPAQDAETDGAPGGKEKFGPPAQTYRKALPAIAVSLAKQAVSGSYLHARALKEIVESEALRKGTRGRKEKGFAQLLLEKIREMEVCSSSGRTEHGGHGGTTG